MVYGVLTCSTTSFTPSQREVMPQRSSSDSVSSTPAKRNALLTNSRANRAARLLLPPDVLRFRQSSESVASKILSSMPCTCVRDAFRPEHPIWIPPIHSSPVKMKKKTRIFMKWKYIKCFKTYCSCDMMRNQRGNQFSPTPKGGMPVKRQYRLESSTTTKECLANPNRPANATVSKANCAGLRLPPRVVRCSPCRISIAFHTSSVMHRTNLRDFFKPEHPIGIKHPPINPEHNKMKIYNEIYRMETLQIFKNIWFLP